MSSVNHNLPPDTCPSCSRATGNRSEYLCPKCGFELAHLDLAPNGAVRGVFGYLLSPGDMLNERYRVRRVLGKGGFGATYLVEDIKLNDKRRALKEIPELLFDEQEVSLLSQLSHSAIPDIIDRFMEGGMIYLVLEFGGSRTLGSECQRLGGKINPAELISYMRQLGAALRYLHSHEPPIVHRDLKPDNILIDDNDQIMLIDFGIAKESLPESTTRVMARAVSRGFSPPEQVLGTGTDTRTDIYALGATLYYLLTGRVPPPASDRVAGKEIEAPSHLVPGLPAEVDKVLLSTLNLNMNERPSKVEDLIDGLVDGLSSLADTQIPNSARTERLDPDTERSTAGKRDRPVDRLKIPLPEGAARSVQRPWRVHQRAVALVAVLIAIVAAGLFFNLYDGSSIKDPVIDDNQEPRTPDSVETVERVRVQLGAVGSRCECNPGCGSFDATFGDKPVSVVFAFNTESGTAKENTVKVMRHEREEDPRMWICPDPGASTMRLAGRNIAAEGRWKNDQIFEAFSISGFEDAIESGKTIGGESGDGPKEDAVASSPPKSPIENRNRKLTREGMFQRLLGGKEPK